MCLFRITVTIYNSETPKSTKRTTVGLINAKSCTALLRVLLVFIRSSLKSVLRSIFNFVYKSRGRQSHRPRGLRRGSAAARLLGLRFRIVLETWLSVSCECRVLSGRGLCVGLITRPEEPCRVCICHREASILRRLSHRHCHSIQKIIRTPHVHEQEYEVLWLLVETKRDSRAKKVLGNTGVMLRASTL